MMSQTDAFFPIHGRSEPAQSAEDVTTPPPHPAVPPVFIYDCVTPFGGETLLLSILKRLSEKDHL